jgi:Flp pilus assembly protein TadD
VTIRPRQSFPYTSQPKKAGLFSGRPSQGFKISIKLLPLVLVLLVGVALGLTKGPSGIAGRVINDKGGTHKKSLEEAYTILVKGDYTEAAGLASAVIRADPSNALAYHILGLADARRGLTEEAITSFKKSVELDPQFALAWFNLGVVEETQGEFASALTDYRTAADLEPSNRGYVDSADRAGRIVMGESQWDWREKQAGNLLLEGVEAVNKGGADDLAYAESVFRSLADQRPYDVSVRNMLGLTLAREGKVDESEQVFLKVVTDEPGYADAWYNLGMVHRAQGRLEDSIEDFRKAADTSTQKALKVAALREIAKATETGGEPEPKTGQGDVQN